MNKLREEGRGKENIMWIYILTAIAMLPMLIFRDFTPANELRYLSIADEALREGHLWCFYNHGVLYADKPPLYLWLAMISRSICPGYDMLFMGSLSLICMFITAAIMDRWVSSIFTLTQRKTALLTLFTCGFFPVMGVTLRMDMMMTMWIVAGMYLVWKMVYEGITIKRNLLLGLFTFLALFTKGPLGIAFPLLCTAVWLIADKKGRLIFKIWNWATWLVILVIFAVWILCVYNEGGDTYINDLLFHQTIDRAHNAFHHKRPFWWYGECVWYVMAPWSLLILWQAIKHGKETFKGEFRKLCAISFIVIFVLLSCLSSKLQIYLLPAIPFAVYWCISLPMGEKLRKFVVVTSWVLLAIVFCGGFVMPKINPLFGYGDVAKEAAAMHPEKILIDSKIARPLNIDAYLNGIPVDTVNMKDTTWNLGEREVLIYKGKKDNGLHTYEGNYKRYKATKENKHK